MSEYLAEYINVAETWEDYEVNDWGKVKDTVRIYSDTPLIKAIRRHDLQAVHALLGPGMADPTLQMCSKRYRDDIYYMPESYKEDARKVSKNMEAHILASYKENAAGIKAYRQTDVEAFAQREADRIVQKVHDATKIAALVEAACSMWPDAPYRSPVRSYSAERGKHANRMRGVTDDDSQTKVTKQLRKKLDSAIEDCLLEPIDGDAIASLIFRNNAHYHIEDDRKQEGGGGGETRKRKYSNEISSSRSIGSEEYSCDESDA